MTEKQCLRTVFRYMSEAERYEASRPNREPGPGKFWSVVCRPKIQNYPWGHADVLVIELSVTSCTVYGIMQQFTGVVERGQGRGKSLGAATLNIPFDDDAITGIYAARVRVKDSDYPAAVYADTRRKLLEAHLLDFEDDLYGLPVTITLVHKIRDDKRFDDADELKKAIAADIEAVRVYFRK